LGLKEPKDTCFAQDPGSLFWCHTVMNLQLRMVCDFSIWPIGSGRIGHGTYRLRDCCT